MVEARHYIYIPVSKIDAIKGVDNKLDLGAPIEQVNYLAGHKSMAMTKRYDHANEERYGGAIEALDEAGKTGSTETVVDIPRPSEARSWTKRKYSTG